MPRYIVEQRQLLGRRRFLSSFLSFYFLPALLDLFFAQARDIHGRVQITGREHMGMATDQLAGDAVDHAGKFEAIFFPGQLAVVHHLKQQVAQLALQVIEVAALDGIGHFVGFFQGMGTMVR